MSNNVSASLVNSLKHSVTGSGQSATLSHSHLASSNNGLQHTSHHPNNHHNHNTNHHSLQFPHHSSSSLSNSNSSSGGNSLHHRLNNSNHFSNHSYHSSSHQSVNGSSRNAFEQPSRPHHATNFMLNPSTYSSLIGKLNCSIGVWISLSLTHPEIVSPTRSLALTVYISNLITQLSIIEY